MPQLSGRMMGGVGTAIPQLPGLLVACVFVVMETVKERRIHAVAVVSAKVTLEEGGCLFIIVYYYCYYYLIYGSDEKVSWNVVTSSVNLSELSRN